jgi:hypothetical protein
MGTEALMNKVAKSLDFESAGYMHAKRYVAHLKISINKKISRV